MNEDLKLKIKARMWEIIQMNNILNSEYQKLYSDLTELEKNEVSQAPQTPQTPQTPQVPQIPVDVES